MHNVHFFVLETDTCQTAIELVEDELNRTGDENNYYAVGGVTNLQGTEQITEPDNFLSPRWTLEDLKDREGANFLEKAKSFLLASNPSSHSLGKQISEEMTKIQTKVKQKELIKFTDLDELLYKYDLIVSLEKDLNEDSFLSLEYTMPGISYWIDCLSHQTPVEGYDYYLVIVDMHS